VSAAAVLPLTWLYVPGDRPDRFDKALASGTDVVILDLEDAVLPAAKDRARDEVVRWLADAPEGRCEVRINPPGSPWHADDVAALASARTLRAVRVAKVEQPDDLDAALATLDPGIRLHCLIETALGVERAFDIASCSSRIVGLGLGEADLRADLGVAGPQGLLWARSRLVVACRAAHLAPPAMSVYTDVHDLDGLAAACEAAAAIGQLGASAVHPKQLPVIATAFLPSPEALARAERTVAEAESAAAEDRGVFVTASGALIDAAVVASARRIVALGQRSR